MNSKRSASMLYIILVICLIITMSVLAHFYVKDKQRDKEYRMITQNATNHIDADTNQGNVINEQDNIINEQGLFHNSNVEPPYLSNSVQPQRNTFIYIAPTCCGCPKGPLVDILTGAMLLSLMLIGDIGLGIGICVPPIHGVFLAPQPITCGGNIRFGYHP